MNEFLNKMYSNENFGIYLMIAIIILILLFIVVLFFGKKDKKNREIEATKKLQQLNNNETDAFKEENVVEKVEVNNNVDLNVTPNSEVNYPSLENDTMVIPNIGEMNTVDNEVFNNEIPEPILPVEEPVVEEVKVEPVLEPVNDLSFDMDNNSNDIEEVQNDNNIVNDFNVSNIIEEPKDIQNVDNEEVINNENNIVETPILEKIEEKPLVVSNTEDNTPTEVEVPFITSINFDTPKEEENVNNTSATEVPEFNFDEVVRNVEKIEENENIKEEQSDVNYTKGPEVFSSVYVPPKEEVELPKVEEISEESVENDFELPTLKKIDEVIEEEKVEDQEEIIQESKDELEDIELPELNDYNLDDITGETYNIK